MKTIDRTRFDDYDLPEEVDFSGAVRGRFYQPKKVSTTIRLDDDIILFFKKLSKEKHIPYQALINKYLRERVEEVMANP